MQRFFSRKVMLLAAFVISLSPAFAQDSTGVQTNSSKNAKTFSTFSIGVNAGMLTPTVPIGGSNSFTKWKPDLGYGLYIRNQFTHLIAVQAEFVRGNLQGNNDNKLGNGQATSNPYNSFKTTLDYAGSISGQLTFNNINWLSSNNKAAVVPYVSAGAGLAGYKPELNGNIKYSDKDIKEFFVPVGAGLKIAAGPAINVDLGYRMNFIDAGNLDGYGYDGHKDKFSYAFAGLEFAFGGTKHPQLLTDNPVNDLKQDLMDKNIALQSSVNASLQQSASEVAALKGQIEDMKKDSDKDGVPDYLDKCPNTPDTVKVDGSGCPLPVMTPPPAVVNKTYIISNEDKRVVAEAIKNLQFEFGKSTIKASSDASLDRVASLLTEKGFSLKLAGYTDNVGSVDANLKLSKDRAEAVKDYLVSKGADASKVQADGFGKDNPIASNKTAAGRAKNRRVEFTLF